jgi:hypothetical protein
LGILLQFVLLQFVVEDNVVAIQIVCHASANGGCDRHHSHRGLKVQCQVHCMKPLRCCKKLSFLGEGEASGHDLLAAIGLLVGVIVVRISFDICCLGRIERQGIRTRTLPP